MAWRFHLYLLPFLSSRVFCLKKYRFGIGVRGWLPVEAKKS